ncbi:MAG: hypothetical protein VCB25_08745 [Myxococcota bacterium]
MDQPNSRSPISRPIIAILVGLVGGFLVLALAISDLSFGGPNIDRSGRLSIHINGVSPRMARDVFLPTHGWVLQLQFPDLSIAEWPDNLVVILRSERTGATIEIQDRFNIQESVATLIVPKQLGLAAGLLGVRAIFTDEKGDQFEDTRRIRIRAPLGGLPVGARQIIHFDFGIDHDDDGTADFHRDLERFGLASRNHPEVAKLVADQIERHALTRVEAAYDPRHDPNQTGLARDFATIRFRPSTDPGTLVTLICVGGSDPSEANLVGHVRFDRNNEDKTSVECSTNPAAGLFPAEIDTFLASPLYQETFDSFLPASGGRPLGEDSDDSLEKLSALFQLEAADQPQSGRHRKLLRAIEVFGNVLGSIMAHEAGHALGLVAEGRPSVGLFGGNSGADYAHNLDAFGESATSAWLMNAGGGLSFRELAGETENGPLRFRPLNHAYLRDRVIVTEQR